MATIMPRQSLVPSLPSKYKNLVKAAENFVETDIKVFGSFSFLLDFCNLSHTFSRTIDT